ncbi:colanic acid exporter, partial [bacterium]|nr:colanic acid exporter [bacterium]
MTLKAQALKGVKWTTTSAVVCSVLQLAKMAILARLIAREDFGLFATIAVILGFADFFVEAGLGSAIIHKQDATEEDLASAYTINILLGWLVFVALYLLSSPVAEFYNDSRLIGLLHLATLVFLFQPLGRQYDALLRRDLK